MESSRVRFLEANINLLFEEARTCPPYRVSVLTDKIGAILGQIEAECEVTPPEAKVLLQQRIRHYRDELRRVKSTVETGGLAQTIHVAEDTEQIAGEVGRELRGQREQLLRTRDRLDETNVELSRISRLVTIIRLRVISNKILLVFLIIIEIAILLALCFIKFVL